MTEADVQKLAPKATKITIYESSIGLQVGDFAQAIGITQDWRRQVKDLYLDLLAMNRSQKEQIKVAKDEAKHYK